MIKNNVIKGKIEKDPKMNTSDFNVLIVDDEEMLRESVVKFFKRKKFNVFEAEDGVIAFDIIKNNKIDFVVSDVRMPNCDGVGLLQNIKTLGDQAPKLIFISGFAEVSREQAIEMGALAFFDKPVERKEVYNFVTNALGISE